MEREKHPSSALTEAEAARRLGVSAAVLRAWRGRHVGPRFCRFGRSVRYLPEDLDAFIAASTFPANDPEHDTGAGRIQK